MSSGFRGTVSIRPAINRGGGRDSTFSPIFLLPRDVPGAATAHEQFCSRILERLATESHHNVDDDESRIVQGHKFVRRRRGSGHRCPADELEGSDWLPSMVNEKVLQVYIHDGYLPRDGRRLPDADEPAPPPRVNEIVILTQFIERGLSLQIHPFLRSL